MQVHGPTESPDGAEGLAAELIRLLEKAISLARSGRWGQVEKVSLQMDAVVARLAEMSHQGQPAVGIRRRRVKELYDQLMVAAEAERESTRGSLKQLRGVKRAVGAYGGQATMR